MRKFSKLVNKKVIIDNKETNYFANKPQSTFISRNRFFVFSLVWLAFSLIVYMGCRISTSFADFISQYVSGGIRAFLGWVTSFVPFSIGEAIIILLLPFLVLFVFFAPDMDEGKLMTRNGYVVLGILILILSVFLFVFAPCYFRTPVENEMSLDRKEINNDDVVFALSTLMEEMRNVEGEIVSDHTGKTLMPYSHKELVQKLNKAYDSLCEKYDFIGDFYSHPKPLAISKLMPYTRISGFYTFFTGEANISTSYPDFMIPYTMAHEMAHQRGIAREDEANFVAFLVCMESDDYYVRYSGCVELMNYLFDALYVSNRAMYDEMYLDSPGIYKNEYTAFVEFVKSTYSQNISAVTTTVNDAMLQSQGQSEGSQSYNLVTELVAAYYKKR